MRSGRSDQREGSCYQPVNFGTKRPSCVGPDRYLIWPFLLPISLKFYRLFQGERTDRATELVIPLITLASFGSGLCTNRLWTIT